MPIRRTRRPAKIKPRPKSKPVKRVAIPGKFVVGPKPSPLVDKPPHPPGGSAPGYRRGSKPQFEPKKRKPIVRKRKVKPIRRKRSSIR